MPIVASTLTTQGPSTGLGSVSEPVSPAGPVIPADTRYLSFRDLDGNDIIAWDTDAYIIEDSSTGLDKADVEVIRQRYPGLRGSRLVAINDLERPVFLSLWLRPDTQDWQPVLDGVAQLRALARHYSVDYTTLEGTFDIVAHDIDGSERALRCAYLDGLQGVYNTPPGYPQWRNIPLSLVAVNPDWRGEEWSTPTVRVATPQPFLRSPGSDGAPLRLGSRLAIGRDMPVTVTGNVPPPAIVELHGPAETAVITSSTGMLVTLDALTSDDEFYLDTGSATVGRRVYATLNGDEDAAWAIIHDDPQWEPLPVGETTISIVLTGTSSATSARVHSDSLWESAWR